MKRLFLFTVMVFTLLFVASCGKKKEMKQMRGVVTSIWSVNDSLVSTSVAMGSDTLSLQMDNARLINGMFIIGDSVQIDYIEDESDTLSAAVVLVLPKPVHYIELNGAESSDTLLTR